jgi:hypothetical protein
MEASGTHACRTSTQKMQTSVQRELAAISRLNMVRYATIGNYGGRVVREVRSHAASCTRHIKTSTQKTDMIVPAGLATSGFQHPS